MIGLLALAIALAQPAPGASPTPAASTTPAPSALQGEKQIQLPATPPPSGPTEAPVYNFVWHPPVANGPTPFPELGAPQILEIDVNDQRVAVPGPLHVRILTSDSVVSVVATAYGYGVVIPKKGPGLFTFDGIVPAVPDTAKNKMFDVDVTAQAKNGKTQTITLPFMLK